MKMKKFIAVLATVGMVAALAAGCGSGDDASADKGTKTGSASSDWDSSNDITIVSREDGSGTRGAFVELFGIQQEVDGEKVDMTTVDAQVTNNTSVMLTTVAGDEYAIGYVSLGSLDESVKALKIDGAEATEENIENGSYKVSRPFNIAVKEGLSEAGQDFMNYILSKEGQAVVADNNYIPLDNAEAYSSNGASGKVVIAGSSSVSPVMEKLKEAYADANSGVEIEIQTSDSTTGMQNAIDGVCDIGMASRELKDSELEAGLTPTVIALDGIAVIVNNNNPTDEMTSDQVKSIFTGDALAWDEAL